MKPFLALSKIVLFYALPQVYSPFTRSSKRPLLYVAFIHEISCQKRRRRRFAPSGTSVSSWHYFVILSHLLLNLRGSAASNKGFTSNGRLVFSPPPPHGDTPSLRISFTSQTPQESQRLQPTSSFLSMTKTLFFPSRRGSCCRGYAILPHRWAGSPSQPTPISKGIKTLRAIANMAYAFSSRYKRRQWVVCSRCAKRRITPAYFSLFPHYFSRKVVHFPAKVVLFFHPLLAPLSFPPGLPNEMAHFPTRSHSFQLPAYVLPPLLPNTYRRERLTFLALSTCCTKQNSSNSSEDELLLFEIRNI